MKKKRSLSSIIVIAGACFIPVIMLLIRVIKHEHLAEMYNSGFFWHVHWNQSWQSMAVFLLPLGVILLTSLVTQIEYKNNTWKQLHTLPISFTTVFFSKLAVIIVMMGQFFLYFNIGIYLSGVIPSWLIGGVPYPKGAFPILHFGKENLLYFIDCLPIIAVQYFLSLRFRNFLVPVGIGFLLFVGSMIGLSWEHGYFIPYTAAPLHFVTSGGSDVNNSIQPKVDIHLLAGLWFVGVTVLSYVVYRMRKEKG